MKRAFFLLISFITLIICPNSVEAVDGVRAASWPGWLFASPESVTGGYTSFCQDADGYIWVGTDSGLIRFGGMSCDVYLSDPDSEGAISDNRVLDLLYDTSGRLWVATANGLNLYDPDTDSFRVIDLPAKNFYGYIIALTEQSDGIVTFVVSGVGVYGITEKDDEVVAFNYLPNIHAEKDFNSLVSSSDGRVYAGTRTGSVVIISRSGKQSEVKVSTDYISGLAIEDDGNLIVGDINNLYRVDINNLTVRRLKVSDHLQISDISADDRWGGVLVSTFNEGLWHVDAGADEARPCDDIYSPVLNLRHATIGALYRSPDGNLWLGCSSNGILMVPVKRPPFMFRKLTDEFPDFNGGIKAMATWNGNVLVGLDHGRVAMLSPGGDVLLNTVIPGGGMICSISVMSGDRAVVGIANEGLWELSLPSGRVSRMLSVAGKYPGIITVPANGNELMVSVFGKGVMLYDTKTGHEQWFRYNNDIGPLFNPYVACMYRTDDGKIWMGLYGGLACYDLNTNRFIPINQDPFLAGATFDIKPVDDSSVLVATSHGLIHFDLEQGVLNKYTAKDGLIDSDVRMIAIDRNGGRWIGSLHGLSYQDPNENKLTSFRGGYGMVENSFAQLVYSDDTNVVYLGSNQGITSFAPDSLLSANFNGCIKFSGIYLNGKKVTPSTQFHGRKIIEGSIGAPESLYLPYQENALTLRLATCDFRDGSNIQYMWHIDGEGDDWSSTSRGENLIYLPHLEPGKYKLQIKGVENAMESEILEVTIRISSPWYMSGVAKVVYVLLLLSMFMLLWIVIRKKQKELENDARIRFFIDISHDIRSPITLILSPLESLLKQPLDEDVRMKLKLMHRNCQRILSLVNQLLEIRKLEKGKMRLKCRRTDVGKFVQELVEMFKPQATDKGLSMEFSEGDSIPEIWLDRDNFDKIFVNLISNAIKYTPSGGEIVVKVERVDDVLIGQAVEVSVTDTGIGLDSKMAARIFERFYQAPDKEGTDKEGFGIGLDLCRRLVEFHHGTIMGRNREDNVKGSVFSVRLPVDGSCYSSDELIDNQVSSREVVTNTHRVIQAQPVNVDAPAKAASKSSLMRRVMVVEDDADLRNYVCGQLGAKYKVVGVSNGAEAMKAIGESVPDLIVSDVMMPEVDGLTLLRRLKSNADTHHIPVILLSSKNAVADRVAGWDKGADAYLGKPFNIDELESLIANLIDNRLRMKGKFSGVQNTGDVIAAPEVKGNDEVLMERMLKIIDRHIDDRTLNVEKLSQEVGVSRAHLNRKMKDMIGMTPSDFIRTIRLRRACELLQKGDIEVTQVAYTLGFTSQPHFSSVFKKFVGVTPSEYRAKWEAGKAPDVFSKFMGKTDGSDSKE